MPYNKATIDKADSDPVNCGTCAYKNDCPAKPTPNARRKAAIRCGLRAV